MQSPLASTVRARVRILASTAASILALLSLGGHVSTGTTPQGALTPQETRGKQIYTQGSSPSGQEVLAYLGESSLEVPGSAMACANCHGLDGKGKPEGGVVPSNLTWEALTKPYDITHPGGRKHPPYTERGLELAITRGLDPAGQRLQTIMPRYQMSRGDMADLIAYLKRLGTDRAPGVEEGRIYIGTVVPTQGALAEVGQAVKAVTNAFFEEVNAQGGIYNRRVELKFTEAAETATATTANVERLLQDEQVFALTSTLTIGSEKEVFALVESRGVPLVGPFTLYPHGNPPANGHVFYLLSDLDGQARALVNFVSQRQAEQKSGLAILLPRSETALGLAEAISDQCQKDGWGRPATFIYPSAHFDAVEWAQKLSQSNQKAIFFLGSGEEALAMLRESVKLRWSPELYLPGTVGSRELSEAPLDFDRKIYLTLPTSPSDQTAEGIKEFRALAEKYRLPVDHPAAQIAAYSAAKVLAEGLKRAGKDLSREKLIAALEELNAFETGLTPPVSYGPNRRVGAPGAYVITIDLKTKQIVPVSPWIGAH